jgi:hypothetical protein
VRLQASIACWGFCVTHCPSDVHVRCHTDRKRTRLSGFLLNLYFKQSSVQVSEAYFCQVEETQSKLSNAGLLKSHVVWVTVPYLSDPRLVIKLVGS